MAGDFRTIRSVEDWHVEGYWILDWWGDAYMARLKAAAIAAIDRVNEAGAEMARNTHPWENRSGQTVAAVYVLPAHYEREQDQVYGDWGVAQRMRTKDESWKDMTNEALGIGPEIDDVGTKDVAMFLEFGTAHSQPYPWIYPAYNATKVLLPGFLKEEYQRLRAMSRNPSGERVYEGHFPTLRAGALRAVMRFFD